MESITFFLASPTPGVQYARGMGQDPRVKRVLGQIMEKEKKPKMGKFAKVEKVGKVWDANDSKIDY